MDPLHGLPEAAPWSLATGEVGRGLVLGAGIGYIVALIAAVLMPKFRLAGTVSKTLFTASHFAIFGALICLGTLFVNNQFQYRYVWLHGDSITPLEYKIAGIWTAQEGSFLLWAVCVALFALMCLPGAGKFTRWFVVACSATLATLCGILTYETPFEVMKEVIREGKTFIPIRGEGMTPALQNYWVVIHPPTIFLGFGSLTVIWAYAVAALIERDRGDWLRAVRPWAIASLSLLGLGLCQGGLWAYETQGWGGFWAWDPVENVSFVPWLLLVGLIHGIIVQISRGRWVMANFILALLPFISFVYGTFLTRSGLLDDVSVHSFASMDKSALAILRGFLIAVTAGSIALLFWRGPGIVREATREAPTDPGVHREGLYRFGMLLVTMLAVVVALGMSWPVITALRGGEGSRVEEWLYHLVVVWFFVPAMLLMAVAPFVSWRSLGFKALVARMTNLTSIAIFLTGMSFIGMKDAAWGTFANAGETINGPFNTKLPLMPVMALLLFCCWFVGVSSLWRAIEMGRQWKLSIGGFIAHFGLAMLLGGLIVSRGFEQKSEEIIAQGGATQMLGYTVAYKDLQAKDLYDRDGKVRFTVTNREGNSIEMTPGLYYYDQGEELKPQVWPYVERYPSHDLYMALFPPITDVWESAQKFEVGQTRTIDGITVTYVEPTRSGEAGMAGTKFGGIFKIKTHDGEYTVNPVMELGEGGARPSFTPVGEDFFAIMGRMDAADRSVELRLMFARPLYPVQLFYKPMTSLVWLGTAILFLGGLMAAFARWNRRVPVGAREAAPEANLDAPIPTT